MALTTLDPITALIIVDLQKGVLGIPAAHPVEQVLHNSRVLADAFRASGLPVVLVNVDAGAPGRTEESRAGAAQRPDGWTELAEELGRQPSDITVTKRTWGAFHGTDLDQQLTRRGVSQVVIAGIATTAGVESTARSAHEHGYNVTLATDAMTDRDAASHDHSVATIFPRLGETGTTREIVDLLAATR